MAYELRELQGNIFKNKHKKIDKHPDMRGEFLLNGVPHDIAIWQKNGVNGPFLGFRISEKRIQPPQEQQSLSQQAQAKVRKPDPISTGRQSIIPRDDDMQDEVPF